jgi:hypothetical protein
VVTRFKTKCADSLTILQDENPIAIEAAYYGPFRARAEAPFRDSGFAVQSSAKGSRILLCQIG